VGTNVSLLLNIFRKCWGSEPGGPRSFLDIGSQHLFGGTTQDYLEFVGYCRGRDTIEPEDVDRCQDLAARSIGTHLQQTFCAELFELVGWPYESVDMYRATIPADLNTFTLEDRHRGAFDLVANFGTTEHVFNQVNCFENIHAAAKPGGFMFHSLPSSGFFYHCLFSYNPKTFLLLAQANQYRIVHAGLFHQGSASDVDDRHRHWAEYAAVQDIKLADVLGQFLFQKTAANEFKLPYDVVGNDYNIATDFDVACASIQPGAATIEDVPLQAADEPPSGTPQTA
jgi:SAM-dependent methyltransferase